MVETDVDFLELVRGVGKAAAAGKDVNKGLAKECQSLFVKSIDNESRTITALASSGSIDRDGDIILPSAFKKTLPEYMRNPVILAAHCHRLSDGRSPVVGVAVKAWIDKKGLWITVKFAETKLGDEYWKLYRDKFQRAFSIGFRGKWEYEQRDGEQVRVYKEVELYEISCVAVPSNRDALSKSAQKKAEFVAQKRAAKQSLQDAQAVDRWAKRLDLWDKTPEGERSKLFTRDEIEEFGELELDAMEFAVLTAGGEVERKSRGDVSDDNEIDLVSLVASKG